MSGDLKTWAFRRLVVAPATIALTALLWVTAPLWLIGAAAISPRLPGRWRALRLLWLMVAYLTIEAVLLVVLFGYWLASGFGRRIRTPYWEGIHYDLVQGTLWVFYREARRVLNLAIETSGPTPDAYPGRPILVCCRHAGPGDSFILMYSLMHDYEREPRVVLKDTLAWDPAIGVILSRIPARFISPNPAAGEDLESQITALATGLDDNDAFVIFPEGGNFTPKRRERGIQRLRKLGLEKMAQRAEQMTNVLAPRPGGIIAALDGAPDADVVLVAHTGLDHMLTVGDVWRELPMDKCIIMRWWTVKRAEIPQDRDERIEWLFGWWEHIDAWISDHAPVDVPHRRVRGRPAEHALEAGRRALLLAGLALVELDDLGRVVRRGRVVRLVGRVGDGLIGVGAARVVGCLLAGKRVVERVGQAVGRRRGRGGGRRRGRDVRRLPVVLLRAAAQLAVDPATQSGQRAEEQELPEPAALGLRLALHLGQLGGGDLAAVSGLLGRGGSTGSRGDLGGRGTGRRLLGGEGATLRPATARRARARRPARDRRRPWRWCPPPWPPPSPGRTRTPASRSRTRRSPRLGR